MIQSSTAKHIEPKALKSAEGKNAGQLNGQENSETDDAQLFADQLEVSMATNVEVAPVEVTADQMMAMPSSLVNPTVSGDDVVETTSPKMFDPALTKGVENLIRPQTINPDVTQAEIPELTNEQVLKIAEGKISEVKGEISQALLKSPQVSQLNGRAPAIEFAQSEIDPQLLNMEDFVNQKNLITKKPLQGQAYGLKPVQQQVISETGLTEAQVVKDIGGLESNSSSVNSQQFILNMMNEQGSASGGKDIQVTAPKTFDMSQIKTSDSNQVMNQITDYIVQAKAAKEPTVNMRVNHSELGMIDITVSKTGMNHETVAINIGTHSADGKNFFQQNSKELFTHLTSAGLNVSELKVETPTQLAKSDFDFGSQSGKQQQGSEKQFGSEQNQRRHEQDRRQELWKLFNQEAA